MNEIQPYVALPVSIMTKVLQTMGTLPHNQVAALMAEVQESLLNADPVATPPEPDPPEDPDA